MRHAVLIVVGFLVCGVPVNATYHEITGGYTSGLTLENSDTILVIDGGIGMLNLGDQSSATIQGTSPLSQFIGGVWELNLADNSFLNFSGGELKHLDIGNDGISILSGGRIDQINSYQYAWQWDYGVDPPELIPNPHITFVCDLESVFHDVGTNVLTGDWLNGNNFEVQLIDVAGNSPAIENIQFIPEPATLLLLGLGGLVVRKRRRV